MALGIWEFPASAKSQALEAQSVGRISRNGCLHVYVKDASRRAP
jgi:hypothetical protein